MVSIAVVAYAGCDMVHELLGHGLACALSPNIRALSLSTVALQTDVKSRFVAAAGSVSNIVAGVVAGILFRRRNSWDAWSVSLGLFAVTNLLNGTGYLIFSGLLNVGDWAVVIAGAEPAWLWRTLLSLVGILLYGLVIWSAARQIVSLVRLGLISKHEPARVLLPTYIAGGLMYVFGSALNPIGPSLILTSGVSSGFGAMAGLAILPSLVDNQTSQDHSAGQTLPFSLGWCVAGAIVALVFIGLLGPGIRL
jgi:hypothetical protein